MPIAKSGAELKKDFFTKVIPNRRNFPVNLIPNLHLKQLDSESLVVIFHELKLNGVSSISIEKLLADGILSDLIDWEAWFHQFAEAILKSGCDIFMCDEADFEHMKARTIEYFFRNIAPKFFESGSNVYANLIDA